jgi:Ssp1 endopeptidase immunity protein Rap1a
MITKCLLAGPLLAVATLGPARAADTVSAILSGDQLLSDCLSKDPDRVLLCAAYVAGVADALAISRAIEGRPPCMPAGATVEQVKDVAVRYLRQHPNYGKKTAAGSVMNAIVAEWKCGEASG